MGWLSNAINKVVSFVKSNPSPTVTAAKAVTKAATPVVNRVASTVKSAAAPVVQSVQKAVSSAPSFSQSVARAISSPVSQAVKSISSPSAGMSQISLPKITLPSLAKPAYAAESGKEPVIQAKPSTFSQILSGVKSNLTPLSGLSSNLIRLSGATGMTGATGQPIRPGSWVGLADVGLTEKAGELWKKATGYLQPGQQLQSNIKEINGDILGQEKAAELQQKYDNLQSENDKINKMVETKGNIWDEMQGTFAALDEKTNKALEEVYKEYLNNSDMSDDDYARKVKEEQQKQLEAYYNALLTNAQSEIPLAESEYEKEKAYLEGQFGQTKTQAEQMKPTLENKYGELLRKITQNKNIGAQNLRNAFSALGTADSSAFGEAMTKLEAQGMQDTSETERELKSKIADIDNKIATIDLDTKKALSDLLQQKNEKIQTIKNNMNLTEAQKGSALSTINQQFAQDLQNLRESRINQQVQFANLKSSIIQGSMDLLKQGQISDYLLGKQYGYSTPDVGITTGTSAGTVKPTTKQKTLADLIREQLYGKSGAMSSYGALYGY